MKHIVYSIKQGLILICAALFVSLGCIREQDVLDENGRKVTVHLSFNQPDTRVSLHASEQSLDMFTSWQSDDKIIAVLYNGQYWQLDPVNVENIMADGKSCTFQYELPKDFKIPEAGYRIWLFTEACAPKVKNSELSYGASLIREPISSFRAPVMFTGVINKNQEPYAVFSHYGTYEILHVSNDSDSPIRFAMSGYSADGGLWFKTRGNIMAADGSFVADTESGGVEVSSEITIQPGSSDMFVSWYIPNGNKLSDAKFTAKINGEFCSTSNRKSSDVVLRTGHAYHLYVTWDGTELSYGQPQPQDLPTEPTAGELIDLGLSVAWASHNVGATKPQEVGGFYAWGETSTKSSYDWSNYALANGSGNSLKKYCTQSSYGTVDNKTTLEPSDDAAYAASKGRMRMPTAAEWQELKDYCVWTKMKYEGQDGYLVASPMTRNAIFIPANGFKTGTSYYNYYAPYYWTADLDTEVCSNALMVDYINQWSLGRQSRNEGLGIRPVSDGLDESTIEVDPTVLDFGKVAIGASVTKPVTVTNTGTGSLTFYLVGGNEWFTFTPEDETTLAPGESCEVTITFRPQSASQMGVVLRVFSNATNGTKYIECTGEGVESLEPVPEMVDMGLSVLWASFNLGADSPTGKGKYYAWGETKAYGEDYPENENNFNYTGKTVKEKYYAETYIFGGQGRLHYVYGGRFSKYNGDDLNTLENQDDAAYLLLGEGWHIPTKEQWEELNNNTTWEQVDGGYRATSTVPGYTNVSIFLPYTGNRYEGSHLNGGYGVYWSSTLNQGEMVHGFNTSKEYGYHGITNEYRWDGLAIRPVHDKVASTTWEMVDLGLSVKWATCNLGASSSTELGQYYAWGETIPDKQDFSWDTYKFGHTTMEMDKYNATDGVTVLSPEDDVVHMTYQGHWRMPTFEEWQELKDNCTWTEDLVNGVLKGYTITSSINGKSIYIPAGGYREGTELRNENTARYWASSLTNASPYYDGYNPGKARNLNENCYYWRLDWMGNDRCWGMQVRGVYDDSSALLSAGELIDMGLSVKWASCNLDASVPEDAGKYYAWGETNPDKTDFSWETYQFGNNAGSMTKYFDVDELHYLDWTDDVVHARLGGHWRMPTIEEWQELKDNCTWINSTRNGVRGYRIVSNINGNCIFLPISGFIDGTQLKDGMRPRYWASSFTNALKGYDGYDAGKARCLNESCYYWRLDLMGSDRYLGMTIRGIYDDSADILTEGETVDLGLSVEWASCNIGADAPEDFGTYYGWGETAPHESYSWENYAFSLGGTKTMTKYNDTDRKVVLDAEDDVVIQKTGGKLRMPTIDEIHELMDNTTQTFKIKNGHIGYILTSKVNGNTIFLPIAGLMDGSQVKDGMRPRYWSRSFTNAIIGYDGYDAGKARCLNESCYYWRLDLMGSDRYLGMPVRGVKK